MTKVRIGTLAFYSSRFLLFAFFGQQTADNIDKVRRGLDDIASYQGVSQ